MKLGGVAPAIVGVGARGPLGLESLDVVLAARAAKLEPRPGPFLTAGGRPAGIVRARFLSDDVRGRARLLALAAPALREALRDTAKAIPLVLGLSGRGATVGREVLPELAARGRVRLDFARSRLVHGEDAVFGRALAEALELLERGASAVVVGAVDSYFDEEAIRALATTSRLLEDAEEGIVPSEGAAFVVLSSDAGESPLGKLAALEVARAETDADDALVDAVRRAAEASRGAVPWVVSDVNGESHRVSAFSRVEMGSYKKIADAHHERLSERFGDTGAAAGALALALVTTSWRTGLSSAASALVALHGAGNDRAAFLVTAPDEPRTDGFRASRGVPSVHRLATAEKDARAPLREAHESPTDAELESVHRRAVVADALLDIAAFSSLRVPLPEQAWTEAGPFEDRLLDNLDALASETFPGAANPLAGRDVIREVERFAAGIPVFDRGRTFAHAFVLASFEGEEGVAAAVDLFRSADGPAREVVGDALRLCMNPLVGPALESLLPSGDSALASEALEVLAFLREVDAAKVASLVAGPDPLLAATAAACLGRMGADAKETLANALGTGRGDAVELAAAEALLGLGYAEGPAHARARLRAQKPDTADAIRLGWMRLVAVAGDASDAELLAASARRAGRDASLLARFGQASLAPLLLDWLEQEKAGGAEQASDPSAFAVALTNALVLLLGSSPAELEPPPREGGESTIVASAAAWRSHWRNVRDRLLGQPRTRYGKPFEAMLLLDELEADSPAGDRADAALELRLAYGPFPFEPSDWTARQRAVLRAIRASGERRNARE